MLHIRPKARQITATFLRATGPNSDFIKNNPHNTTPPGLVLIHSRAKDRSDRLSVSVRKAHTMRHNNSRLPLFCYLFQRFSCVSRDHSVCRAVFVDGRCIMVSKQDSRLHQQLLGQMPSDGRRVGKELFAFLPLPFSFFPYRLINIYSLTYISDAARRVCQERVYKRV